MAVRMSSLGDRESGRYKMRENSNSVAGTPSVMCKSILHVQQSETSVSPRSHQPTRAKSEPYVDEPLLQAFTESLVGKPHGTHPAVSTCVLQFSGGEGGNSFFQDQLQMHTHADIYTRRYI